MSGPVRRSPTDAARESDPRSAQEDRRPRTSAEKEAFSSGGKRGRILLRGKWGLAIDRVVLWCTGYSPVTHQYALAGGEPYTSTLMLTGSMSILHTLSSYVPFATATPATPSGSVIAR